MKMYTRIIFNKHLVYSMLLSCLAVTMQAETAVKFQNITLKDATSQGKKILVSFSSETCLPCKVMDELLYSDPEISNFINKYFTAVKANVDCIVGLEWNNLYNANYLPTTLFTTTHGREIERLNGIPLKDNFLAFLKRMLSEEEELHSFPQAHFASSVSIVKERPIQIVEKKTQVPSNYLVQMGAFGSRANAQRLIDQLKEENHLNQSILEEISSNGSLMYKVVMLGFSTESEAIKTLILVQRQGFDGFIKKL